MARDKRKRTSRGGFSANPAAASRRPRGHPRLDPDPAPTSECDTNPALIQQLPLDVLADILERLGLQAAAAARAVCRRWREAAEAVLWRRLDVNSEYPDGILRLARQLADSKSSIHFISVASGRRQSWIRVATGASLRLQLGVGDRIRASSRRREGWSSPWAAALALVAACSRASGGLGNVEMECSLSSSSSSSRLSEFLRALIRPGAASCPSLRSIELRDDRFLHRFFPHSIEPLLRGLRGPLSFPNLERLSLPKCCPVKQLDAAAAVDQLLPRLKRLEIALEDFKDAAASGLAGLSALESLEIHLASGERPPHAELDAAPLLEALASGPAARSLKELRCYPALSAAALRALPRLPALERLQGSFMLAGDAGEEGLAALGSLPALRSLGLLNVCDVDGNGQIAGLAAALDRSASLESLELRLYLLFQEIEIGALARLARASRGRLSLEMHIVLHSGWPAAAAAALAAAPLRRLALNVAADEGDMRGGLLDGLSAFAGCSAGVFEVHVLVALPDPDEFDEELQRRVDADAAQAALARALPGARVVIGHHRS